MNWSRQDMMGRYAILHDGEAFVAFGSPVPFGTGKRATATHNVSCRASTRYVAELLLLEYCEKQNCKQPEEIDEDEAARCIAKDNPNCAHYQEQDTFDAEAKAEIDRLIAAIGDRREVGKGKRRSVKRWA